MFDDLHALLEVIRRSNLVVIRSLCPYDVYPVHVVPFRMLLLLLYRPSSGQTLMNSQLCFISYATSNTLPDLPSKVKNYSKIYFTLQPVRIYRDRIGYLKSKPDNVPQTHGQGNMWWGGDL